MKSDERKLIMAGELIGKKVTIKKARDQQLEGNTFTVVDETKNTLVMKNKRIQKTLIKKEIEFEIQINQKKITIKGEEICQRPKQRTKTVLQSRQLKRNLFYQGRK